MRFHHPDPAKLQILETNVSEQPWIAYSDDPEWVALSIRRTGVVLRFHTKEEAQEWKELQLKQLPVIRERTCGPCHACCTPLAIEELQKPPGVRCKHLGNAPSPCTIYTERPTACREYFCGWRLGLGDAYQRPDLVGLLFTPHPNRPDIIPGLGEVTFVVHEVWPLARKEPPGERLLLRVGQQGFLVFVVYGPKLECVQVIGPDDLVRDVLRWCNQHRKFAPFGILAGYDPAKEQRER